MTIKIGYQGIEYSNSEIISKAMASQLVLNDVELIPLVSSINVVNALKDKKIDYGVVAFENSIGGIVEETQRAIKNEHLKLILKQDMLICHTAFKKNNKINNNEINKVISHIQALKQCKNNIRKNFPYAQIESIEDTAIGAKYLSEGKYSYKTVVLCSKEAGLKYRLHIEHEHMEDRSDNTTEFRMYSLI